jgi:hypothetical protein
MKLVRNNFDVKRLKQILLIVAVIVILFASAAQTPTGWDFKQFFRPAAQAVLNGKSPYSVDGFYNPPWLSIMFVPFALLPERLSWMLFYSFNLVLFTLALKRLGAKMFSLVLIMMSPYVFYSMAYGNVDSMVLLGATLPPSWGIWLILLKPQMSIGILALWLYQSVLGGWRQVIRNFGVISLVYIGTWLAGLHPKYDVMQLSWNINAWPWGLIPGIILLWLAIRKKYTNVAFSSSPYFSPYVSPQSWMVILLPVLEQPLIMIAGTLLGWFFVLMRMLIKAEALKFEPILLIAWGLFLIIVISKYKRDKDTKPISPMIEGSSASGSNGIKVQTGLKKRNSP